MTNTSIQDSDIQNIEKVLRTKLEAQGLSAPEHFPCPIPGRVVGKQALNRYVDHTLLKQAATRTQYDALFAEARAWQVFSVCIPPVRLTAAAEALEGSGVKLCTVVGFPWGYESSEAKAADTRRAVAMGCHEVDMVISLGELIEGNYSAVYTDIRCVVDAAGGVEPSTAHRVKVILETSELSSEDIVRACLLSCWAGACFVKTSTGFASAGATAEDIRLMRRVVGERIGVKASGGIRTREVALELIRAGADRLGTSATGAILGISSAQDSSGKAAY